MSDIATLDKLEKLIGQNVSVVSPNFIWSINGELQHIAIDKYVITLGSDLGNATVIFGVEDVIAIKWLGLSIIYIGENGNDRNNRN